ncbi:MAG: hypothetical protein AAFV80_24320, partial [Bacteroidota bacterium]
MKTFYPFLVFAMVLCAVFLFLPKISSAQITDENPASGSVFVPSDDPSQKISHWYEFIQKNRRLLAKQHLQFVEAQYQNQPDLHKMVNDSLIQKHYESVQMNLETWKTYSTKLGDMQFNKPIKAVDRVLDKWQIEVQGLEIDLQKWRKANALDKMSYTMRTGGLNQRIAGIQLETSEFKNGQYIVKSDVESQQSQRMNRSKPSKNNTQKQVRPVNSEYRFYANQAAMIEQNLYTEQQDLNTLGQARNRLNQFLQRLENRTLTEPDLSYVNDLKANIDFLLKNIIGTEMLIGKRQFRSVFLLQIADVESAKNIVTFLNTHARTSNISAIHHTE